MGWSYGPIRDVHAAEREQLEPRGVLVEDAVQPFPGRQFPPLPLPQNGLFRALEESIVHPVGYIGERENREICRNFTYISGKDKPDGKRPGNMVCATVLNRFTFILICGCCYTLQAPNAENKLFIIRGKSAWCASAPRTIGVIAR